MDAEEDTEIDPYDLVMDLMCNDLDLKGLGCDVNIVSMAQIPRLRKRRIIIQ